jgi:hypothetical protein
LTSILGDTQPFHTGDPQSYHREKELLFESLKVHTREEVRWEDVLDNRWKGARNNCAKIVPELRRETSEVVNSFLNQEQERETNFLQRVKEGSGEDDPAEQMAEVVLREINVKSGDEIVLRFFGNTNMGLAKKVTHICNSAVNNLCKGDVVRKLRDEVRDMKKASEELREILNPVKLRPMILRTRCNLCPA